MGILFSSNVPPQQTVMEKIQSRYNTGRQLGAGAFGVVYLLCHRTTNEKRALKIVDKAMLGISSSAEANIMMNIKHPNIIQMFEYDDSSNCVYMIMEYMSGGDLNNRIRQNNGLPEDVAIHYFSQICRAVDYLHQCKITHRDIKPENVLLKTREHKTLLKLTDFGLSNYNENMLEYYQMMTTFCGTPQFIAPEVMLAKQCAPYTSKVDIWSMGVLLFQCITAKLPFLQNGNVWKYNEYDFNHPAWTDVSIDIQTLITHMLMVNPNRRWPIQNIICSLNGYKNKRNEMQVHCAC